MRRHTLSVVMSLVASVISGTVFVVALFEQFALVEMAASIVTALQVFFLSSAIGDWLEKKKETSRTRNSAVVLVTIFLVAFYSFRKYFH
jgi:membrane protein DedA with SNARE-associated domain